VDLPDSENWILCSNDEAHLNDLPASWEHHFPSAEFFADPQFQHKTVFWLLDPKENLADSIESTAEILEDAEITPAKILTVVDCQATEKHSVVQKYYQASIHFSDVVLLGNREDVSQKWLREWQETFRKGCFPCDFHMIKKGGHLVEAQQIIYPDIRRITQVFDPPEEETAVDPMLLPEWEASFDPEDEEELPPPTESDPWLARHPNGARQQIIPDVSPFTV
jgi:hypothetical protein